MPLQRKKAEYNAKVNQEASSFISKTFSLTEVAANTNPVIAEQNRQIAEQKEAFEKQQADERGKSGNELVVESWDKVKAIPNHQNIAGELLFRRIFELNPETTALFQFAKGYSANDDDMYKNEMFVKHSTAVISTVTVAVGLLKEGNMDTLVSVLKDLGARHAKFDLGEAHYSLVGESLLFTLEKALGPGFTSKVNESWVGVYKIISEQMMLGAQEYAYAKTAEEKQAEAERNEPSKELVIESWAKVKVVPEYEKVVGELIFRRMFDLQPDATSFFPFSEGYSLDDDEMYESALFEKHIIAVVSSINAAIELLEKDDMKTLVSVLKDLGVRHAAFDLEMFHYDLVGEALLFALRETVGHSFDGRMKNAWAGVFGIITDTMMQGTKEFVERQANEEKNVDAAGLISKSFFLSEAAANADPEIAKQNCKIAEQKEAYEARVADLVDRKQNRIRKLSEEKLRTTHDAASLLVAKSFSLTEIAANADPTIAAQNRQIADERKAFECRQATQSNPDKVAKSEKIERERQLTQSSSLSKSKSSKVAPTDATISSAIIQFSPLKVLTLLLLTGLGGFFVGLSNHRVDLPVMKHQTYASSNERTIGKKLDALQTEINVLEKDYRKTSDALESKLLELQKKVDSNVKTESRKQNPIVGLVRKITKNKTR